MFFHNYIVCVYEHVRVSHLYKYAYPVYKCISLRVEPQGEVVVYPGAKCPVALDGATAAHANQ